MIENFKIQIHNAEAVVKDHQAKFDEDERLFEHKVIKQQDLIYSLL